MAHRTAFALILSLGVLLALSGVISAARMAPDPAAIGIKAHALVYGSMAEDLCGGTAGHDHHCPLCHALPDAPASTHAGRHFLLQPHDAWHRRDDLQRAAQARNLCHSPRAPPVRA